MSFIPKITVIFGANNFNKANIHFKIVFYIVLITLYIELRNFGQYMPMSFLLIFWRRNYFCVGFISKTNLQLNLWLTEVVWRQSNSKLKISRGEK